MNSLFQSIPERWHRTALRHLARGPKNGAWGSEAGENEVDAICVRVADFDWPRLSLRLDGPTIRSFNKRQFKNLQLRRGDIVIEKSGGGEKTPVGRVVSFDEEIDAVTSNFVARIRPHEGVCNRFFLYLLAAHYMSGYSHQFIKQNTGIQNLDDTNLFRSEVWVPDLATQRQIADFLDRETARIDLLIEKKQRLVALLEEEHGAVIAHSVTKGVNSNAPMKDSGEDWLGKIPAHWEVVPPTALFTESKERAHDGDEMLSATQKYGVIPLAKFEALEQRQVTKAFTNLEKRKHVEVGDFVISMRSMDGGLEQAHATGSVRSSYSVLKAGPAVEGRFFRAVLKSCLYIQALRLTSNFIRDGQDMNFGHFRKVRLPKPPIDEQTEIANLIEAQTTRIKELVSKTNSSIGLIKEYRSALITAAVTGQIDVQTYARSGTTDRRLDAIQEEMSA